MRNVVWASWTADHPAFFYGNGPVLVGEDASQAEAFAAYEADQLFMGGFPSGARIVKSERFSWLGKLRRSAA